MVIHFIFVLYFRRQQKCHRRKLQPATMQDFNKLETKLDKRLYRNTSVNTLDFHSSNSRYTIHDQEIKLNSKEKQASNLEENVQQVIEYINLLENRHCLRL